MGSKSHAPPSHLRRPLPGPGIVHPETFGPGIHPPRGPYPPYDMLPPPEVMEQKLAAQHVEMQRLATENQRLAATHGTLRQELAASQHELQFLHAQIAAIKSEREQQMRSLLDKISKMEAELQAADPIKAELQQARADAQSLIVDRQELISKAQQLSLDLQRTHADVQQIPALISELESLRQEYQHCRASYDYEKKLYNDHLESLQVMEKNYVTMAREVENLRAQLPNAANVDRRTGGTYGGTPGKIENETSGLPGGHNAYEDGYGAAQGRGPIPTPGGNGTGTATATAGGALAYIGAQTGGAPPRTGYDAPRGPHYDTSRGAGYDASAAPAYDAQQRLAGAVYDMVRGSGYDSQGGAMYDPQRSGYDLQRGQGYDAQRGPAYDARSRGAAGPRGHVPPANNVPYIPATQPTHGGSSYNAPPRGVNANRR